MTPQGSDAGARLDRVVVLAGGRSTRLGEDKTRVGLAGAPVLDHLLRGLAAVLPGVPVTVVGEARPTVTAVAWAREDPPGGGPVAGTAAGTAGLPDDGVLAVIAGDLPFAAPAAARLALALSLAGAAVDSVLARDLTGRDQLLLGVHRVGPLRAALGDDTHGRSMRSVVDGLVVHHVVASPVETLDVDTPADLDRARVLARRRA